MNDPDKTSLAGTPPADTVTAGATVTAVSGSGTALASTTTSAAGATAVASATAAADAGGSSTGAAAHAATFDLSSPKSITLDGKVYTVEKLIGDGGEAEVYKLLRSGRPYALKLYRGVHKFNDELIKRIAGLKDKAAVVEIYGYGTTEIGSHRRSYTLMQYCKDGSTASWSFKGNADAILQIVTLTARNLNELHKAGILHKDTKPENLLFTDKQNYMLLLSDFGISDLLGADGSVNSPQDRTVIYAAPEIYTNASIINGRTYAIMTRAYDYYALGMSALALWMGSASFKRKEPELVKMKIEGKINIPDDMPDPLRTIVRGLLVKDPASRWGFDEIRRKLSGEDVPVGENLGSLNIVFDSGKNKIARTPEDLARFMMEDQQLGISYLYKGRICDWLRKPAPELEMKINDIIETRYPKNQTAGLYAAALTLDPGLPYYDLKGKTYKYLVTLHNNEEKFKAGLTDRNNPLYIYIEARMGKAKADEVFGKVKRAAADKFKCYAHVFAWAIHETDSLAYAFYGAKTAEEQLTKVECHNLNDVLKFFSEYRRIPEDNKKFVCSLGFVEMVSVFSPSDARKIEALRARHSDFQSLYRLIIQTLNPAADINLCSDPSDPMYAMTGQGLGRFINMAFNAYYVQFEGDSRKMYASWSSSDNPYRDICQASLVDLIVASFKGDWNSSFLHDFFMTKGTRFSKQDSWAAFCTSYDSTDNTRKYGPYDMPIAMLKTAAGFGFSPEYRFRGSSRTVRTIAELDSLAASNKDGKNWKDETAAALRSRSLHAWLAVQYQENPQADLKKKYAYEELTRQYVEKLGSIDAENREYKRWSSACEQVTKAGRSQSILLWGLLQSIFIVAGCLILIFDLLLTLSGIISQPLLDISAKNNGILIYGPLVLSLLINQYFSRDRIWGIFQSIIMYAMAMFFLYFINRWLLWKYAHYVVLAGIGLYIWYFFRKLLRRNEGASELRTGRKPDYEQRLLEPLHFAFKSKDSSFQSSCGANDWYYKEAYKDSLREKGGPTTLCLVTAVILFFSAGFSVSIGGVEEQMYAKFPRLAYYVQGDAREGQPLQDGPVTLTQTDNVAISCSSSRIRAEFTGRSDDNGSSTIEFSLTNLSDEDLTPVLITRDWKDTFEHSITASTTEGRTIKFSDGNISVSLGDASAVHGSDRKVPFTVPAGATVNGKISVSGIDETSGPVNFVQLPLKNIDGKNEYDYISIMEL